MSICLRYAKDENDALEILNDGFLKIFKGLDRFKPKHANSEGDFRAWLKQIMVYTAIDHYRKNEQHATRNDNIEAAVLQIASSEETQLERISHKEIIENIQRLSPAYRTVFSLFVIEGYSHEEIGRQLGISVGTSKSNLSKAKLNLQKMLEPRSNNLQSYGRKVV